MMDADYTGGECARESEIANPGEGAGGPHLRAELEQLRLAVRDGWNVPAETRAKIMARLSALVEDPKTNARQLLSLTRVIAQLARDDVEAAQPVTPPVAVQIVANTDELSAHDRHVLAEAGRLLRRQTIATDSQSQGQ